MDSSGPSTPGQRLQAWMKAHGYGEWGGQKRFSEDSGIRQQQLSRYMQDEAEPAGEVRLKLARMGLNLHWYDTGEGPMDAPRKGRRLYPGEVGASGEVIGTITIEGKSYSIVGDGSPEDDDDDDNGDQE